ncbi:hypothetical protein [Paenibacillus radicis (ex Gao et al. 2016)]|uniref:hypothetical protein n=1 Tax=Paenibacillus radicis (ex Gao et al. 2016) TaxID=1737354 RepID=UPI001665D51C|nr:hypothetical protein [Paenibacillus radicis (ex Gao et al. 2016)]
MATSKAKKLRQKQERQGMLNPESLRGSWHHVNPASRTTPGLQDKQNRIYNKHKRNHASYGDDSFCVCWRLL